MRGDRSQLGRVNYTKGRKLEGVVAGALRIYLYLLGFADPDVSRSPPNDSHYDIELVLPDRSGRLRRAYVEVKGSERLDRLRWYVDSAFKRDHPEPFAVVGVLGYPDDPGDLLSYPTRPPRAKAWIWISPGRRLGRFTERNLGRWLRWAGLL